MTRRYALSLLSALSVSARANQHPVSLGFSLYGMKGVPLPDAIRTCADLGYDGVEICLTPGWTPPESFSPEISRTVREALKASGQSALGFMEQLSVVEREMPERVGVERLRNAAAIGHQLVEGAPLIETVLGGKSSDWAISKVQMASRLHTWALIAQRDDFVLCVKAHAGAAVDTPEKLLWLYKQVNVPSLKLTYDYSHFQVAKLSLEESFVQIIPEARFIHVKDAEGTSDHPRFLLAGDGTVDYNRYFELINKAGYSGPIVAEVSAQLQRVAGYDPVHAARRSYQTLATAARHANLHRQRNSL